MQKASGRKAFQIARRLSHLPAALISAALASAVLASVALFSACAKDTKTASAVREVFAMDTYMKLSCYGDGSEAAADEAVSEIKRIDALLSIGSESGSVRRVNESGRAAVDAETALIVEKAIELHGETGGAFDITVLPLMELWGFTSGDYRVPESSEIAAALEHIGSEKLSLSNGELSLGSAAGIDLGGIAKGYTSDRLTELFRERGISSACVSLGGNVQCLGAKPDGTPWRCGIVHPFNKDGGEYLGIVSVADKAVITSGAYERNFTDAKTGRLYHHIIDPSTGYPAETGLASVTIVSSSGILADALSTACFIMGLEGSIDYWNASGRAFDMILMRSDGGIFITPGIAGSFTSSGEVHIIDG